MTVDADSIVSLAGVLMSMLASLAAVWRSLDRRLTRMEIRLEIIERDMSQVTRWFADPGPSNGWVPLPDRMRHLEDRLASVEARL